MRNLFLLSLLLIVPDLHAMAPVKAIGLTVHSTTNPLGTDILDPPLSWKIASSLKGVTQTAWQVQIATGKEALQRGSADVWDSGKRDSDIQLNIRPEGAKLQPATRYWWRVKVWTNRGESPWSEPACFTTGLDSWQAQWITRPWPKQHRMPYLRQSFTLPPGAKIDYATAYICALGCGELYLNGQRTDDRCLDPAQSDYNHVALYSSIDVTSLLRPGNNRIGVMLGDGWYNQNVAWGGNLGRYGDPMLRLQLEIVLRDGTRRTILSSTEWEWAEGPVVSSNLYAGEHYDARLEIPNWSHPGSGSESWQPCIAAKNPPPAMRSQLMPPMREFEELAPVRIFRDKAGRWIFDFGRNITGWPRLLLRQPAGTTLTLRMAEAFDGDSLDFRSTGVYATKVIQTNTYICKGGFKETWTPRFTYHGFRYVELTGQQGTPSKNWMQALVMNTDVAHTGHFNCSDPQINRLHEMALHTMLGNFHGLPTDCPHRERCGWLGDVHAYLRTAALNFDMENFWIKYMGDILTGADRVEKNALFHALANKEFYRGDKIHGIPYMIAPGRRLCGVASPDWGTTMIQLPWGVYTYYGNLDFLRQNYPAMRIWVEYVRTLLKEGIVSTGLGDWCPPGGFDQIDCPVTLSSSILHYHDMDIMERTATLLNIPEDVTLYSLRKDSLQKAILAKFYDPATGGFGSQTGNAMALAFGLTPEGEQKKTSDNLVSLIASNNSFMHMGIMGLPHLGNVLSDYGNASVAWNVFTKKGVPSFAAMWEFYDATSLWEVLPVDTTAYYQGDAQTRSQSHPMQAGYGAWFYESIAGIRPVSDAPGFKKIIFAPAMMEYLTHAEASIETRYGPAASLWKRNGKKVTWEITLPPNTSGKLYLPGKNLRVDGSAPDPAYIKKISESDNIYTVASGSYTLTFDLL